jgi:hypothetical protein
VRDILTDGTQCGGYSGPPILMWVPAEVDRETHVQQGDLSASAHPPSADSTDASTKRGSQINYQSP